MQGKIAPVYEDLGGEYGGVLLHVYANNEHPILFTQVVSEFNIESFFNEQLPMDAVTVVSTDEEKWESKGWRFGRLGMQARVPIFFSKDLAEWYVREIMGNEENSKIVPCIEVKEKSETYFIHGAYVILEATNVEEMESMVRNLTEYRDRVNTGIAAIEAKIKKIKPEVTQI